MQQLGLGDSEIKCSITSVSQNMSIDTELKDKIVKGVIQYLAHTSQEEGRILCQHSDN